MIGTQIYLTKEKQKILENMSKQTGKKKSDLIREAVDEFISKHQGNDRLTLLKKAKGMWRDRDDLPKLENLRREWDRK